ncbi:MAG TPA: hypothetical protein VGB66_12935 [Longimicrobium sp.]|jgi:hypothetical protein
MKKTILAAALAVTTLAGAAQAQVCASYPTVDRNISLNGRIDFPENLDSFGVEASYNAAGPLSVFGGLNVLSGEGDDSESEDLFFAGLAFETPQIAGMLGPRASACPQVRVEYADFDGLSYLRIPVGLGFGATLATSPSGPTISPYVIPQVVFTQLSIDEVDEDESETNFGVRGGALVTFGMFFFGGEVNYTAGDFNLTGDDAVFGLRAGVRF